MGIKPLISAELWSKAQKLMDQKRNASRARRRQHDDVSFALGLLRCACGRFHYLQRTGVAASAHTFYCASRRPGPSCGAPTLRRIEVERAMERAITNISLTPSSCSLSSTPPLKNRTKGTPERGGNRA